MLNYEFKTIIFQCSKNDGSPTRVTRLKWHQTCQTQSVLTERDRSLNAGSSPGQSVGYFLLLVLCALFELVGIVTCFVSFCFGEGTQFSSVQFMSMSGC